MLNNYGKPRNPGANESAKAVRNAENLLNSKDKDIFYAKGLRFSCTRCSDCCRFESGFVFLSKKDVSMLGEALNIGFSELVKSYCRWIPSLGGGSRLSLREKSSFDCIFWKNGCTVYEKRPLQCRAFPFWSTIVQSKSSWELASSDCPGIGNGALHSRETVEKWLAQRQEEPIIIKGEP